MSSGGAPPSPAPASVSATITTAAGGELRLHATTWGDAAAPPLILLHGWATCSLAWRAVAPALARDFYVVAPDNRGNGRSEREPPDLALESYAEDTLRLCQALNLERPAVIGHSWGANIGQILASLPPPDDDAFSKFILLDPVNWAMTHAFASIVPGIIAQRRSREDMGLLPLDSASITPELALTHGTHTHQPPDRVFGCGLWGRARSFRCG